MSSTVNARDDGTRYLDFHAQRSVVQTASALSVRQPVHTRSKGVGASNPTIAPGLFAGLGSLTSIDMRRCKKLKLPDGLVEGLEARGVEVIY